MMRWYALVGLMLLAVVMPVVAQDDTSGLLEDVLAEFAEADGAAVVVQVTTSDETWTAATGLADGERAAEVDDRFRIGSMSKTFVATLALMMAEDGLFNLDDRAADWLPDEVVENVANADVVTIRQLLSMRSGIDDYLGQDDFWIEIENDPNYAWTAEEAIRYAYGLPALAEPDAEFYYSNSNYLLLQMVLEGAASGQPIDSLMRERILDPLGLNDTYTQVSESLPGGFVYGYEDFDGDGEAENVSAINDGAGLADGGLVSTVGDLTTFYQALLVDESLLSAESMGELMSFLPDDEGGGYSLGLGEWETDYGTAWGHSGGVLGFLSIGFYLPEADVIVIVLSADAELDPYDIAAAAVDAVMSE